MNRLLKQNLQSSPDLYFFIEDCFDLNLGVADKAGLLRHLSEHDYSFFQDLLFDTRRYLWDMGYRSKKLEESVNQIKINERNWAECFTRVIEQKIDWLPF